MIEPKSWNLLSITFPIKAQKWKVSYLWFTRQSRKRIAVENTDAYHMVQHKGFMEVKPTSTWLHHPRRSPVRRVNSWATVGASLPTDSAVKTYHLREGRSTTIGYQKKWWASGVVAAVCSHGQPVVKSAVLLWLGVTHSESIGCKQFGNKMWKGKYFDHQVIWVLLNASK